MFVEKFERARGHKLWTKELADSLPDYGKAPQDGTARVLVKYFSPTWRWYVTEIDRSFDEPVLFGFVDGDFPEFGSFALSELEQATYKQKFILPDGRTKTLEFHAVERDLYWDDTTTIAEVCKPFDITFPKPKKKPATITVEASASHDTKSGYASTINEPFRPTRRTKALETPTIKTVAELREWRERQRLETQKENGQ